MKLSQTNVNNEKQLSEMICQEKLMNEGNSKLKKENEDLKCKLSTQERKNNTTLKHLGDQEKVRVMEMDKLQSDITRLTKEINTLENENKSKLEEIKRLQIDAKVATDTVSHEKRNSETSNCLRTLKLRFPCDFCGERFEVKPELKTHIKNEHEVKVSRKILSQKFQLLNKLQTMKSSEIKRTLHKCDSRCRFNHNIFNTVYSHSEEILGKLSEITGSNEINYHVSNVMEKNILQQFFKFIRRQFTKG